MSAGSLRARVQTVDEQLAPRVTAFLEQPEPGMDRTDAVLAHQQLLDAIDRHEYRRLLIWPEGEPAAVAHLSTSGTLVVAGTREAGADFATHLSGSGWRVLLGDAPLADCILESSPRPMMRRRSHAREQRFMATRTCADLPTPAGLRIADMHDLGAISELACRLHVEDRMGPPLSRGARSGVTERMRSSVRREATWVVEQGGDVAAKFDISLRSPARGAQIAGVYVKREHRGAGLAARGVAAVARHLMTVERMPGVTLHVRSDNAPGRRAYERAGFADRGAWTLALR